MKNKSVSQVDHNITDNLKKLIKERDITEKKMCRKLEISYFNYSNCKRNLQRWNMEYVFKLAQYFDVTIEQLASNKPITKNRAGSLMEENKILKEKLNKLIASFKSTLSSE